MHPVGDAHTALFLHHATTRERIAEADAVRRADAVRQRVGLRGRLARLAARDRAPQAPATGPARPA